MPVLRDPPEYQHLNELASWPSREFALHVFVGFPFHDFGDLRFGLLPYVGVLADFHLALSPVEIGGARLLGMVSSLSLCGGEVWHFRHTE